MLYNPKWSNPLSLEAFADWLEAKPKDEPYNFYLADRCAWGQFSNRYEPTIMRDDIRAVVKTKPWTFGAATARARAILAGGSVE